MIETLLNWYDPKRKKPVLRIKILRLIGSVGSLSVHGADQLLGAKHHHNEVWESFHALQKNKLITVLKLGKFYSGRKQNFYGLTETGLSALIQEGMSPYDFWRALINFYRFAERVNFEVIDRYYLVYIRTYLKYQSVVDNHSYIFQLDIFDHMCQKWVRDNIKEKEISLSQKILEVLALQPNLPPKQIAEKIDISIEIVNEELKRITRDTTFENGGFLIGDDQPYDSETLLDILSDFMLHNIIKTTDGTGNVRFSLSLYGVMLTVYLVLNHNANRIAKNLFLMDKRSIQYSLDTISKNYSDTLPLIFGQWDLLKSILKVMSVYNFQVIIDKKVQSDLLQTPVSLKGFKEYYDDMQGVSLHSRKQLIDLYKNGISAYTSYRIELDSKKMKIEKVKEDASYEIRLKKEKKELEKAENAVKAIKNKLVEISSILGYSSGREVSKNKIGPQKYGELPSDNSSAVTKFQRAFANEITFLYYISQDHDRVPMPVMLPAPDFYKESSIPPSKREAKKFWARPYDKYSLAPQKDHFPPLSSKQRLHDILKGSPQIRELLINSINDCIIYHDQSKDIMEKWRYELSSQTNHNSQLIQ
jgi:hypothetical protein